jgi:acetyltransferase-like isoleucine patch superfamily enzyme
MGALELPGTGASARRARRLAGIVLRGHLPVYGWAKPLARSLYLAHVAMRETSIMALRFCWYEPLFRGQCESVGKSFRMERLPYISGRGRILIGDHVRLSGKSTVIFSNRLHARPELLIGDDTFIGHDCALGIGSTLSIGRHCLIAGGVRLFDFDGHPLDAARRRAKEPTPPEGVRPITLGDDVWIGAGAQVLKGVTIGPRSVVGAGAVVTKDVQADVVVAGNPAQIVKRLAG